MTQTTNQPTRSLDEARASLAQEWQASAPATPEAINDFYQTATGIADDLHAWHATKSRQTWTKIATHVAQQIDAKMVVDIGCGAGYELLALREAGLDDKALIGVEPNERLAHDVRAQGFVVHSSVEHAPIDQADMLICLDVLEHVVDPEAFLGAIAAAAKPNCVLVESTATFDVSTPLHLAENRGWHPGHVLELNGWEILDSRGRVRVWQRMRPAAEQRSGVLLCAYRSCSIPTMNSLLALQQHGWRIRTKWSDGLISRARSVLASRWWAETADDVLLMIDDDIVFEPAMAERLVALCRDGHDLVCAAYPVRDGGHLAIRGMDQDDEIQFGDGLPPREIKYAATGFFAVHRRVLDAMIPTQVLCHQNQPWAFWPMFDPMAIDDGYPAGWNYLSEDWAFCERARQLGFNVWLDPGIRLGHLAQLQIDVGNMDQIYEALRRQREDDDEDEGWM